MSESQQPVLSRTLRVVDYGSTIRTESQRQPSFVLIDSPRKFIKMSHSPNETQDRLQRLEYFLNVLNQICIGFVTIYMSYLTLRTGLAGTSLHAWLVTIGFSFFMAEGVMIHYGGNVLTNGYKRQTKTTIHWVLLTLGGCCGASGALIKMIQKGFMLQSTHGKLGMTAFVLCILSMSSGLAALFSARMKKLIAPLLNKTFHNFLGFACFAIALVTQYYGYQTGYFKARSETDFQILMKCLTLTSLVLSSYGPVKALYQKCRNISQQF
ncbi:hypothetical protein KR009_004393 [Drosophila setifemur]|nr:hypothetical protein KR009_004393 [Drosophila setifemur]